MLLLKYPTFECITKSILPAERHSIKKDTLTLAETLICPTEKVHLTSVPSNRIGVLWTSNNGPSSKMLV